MGPTTAATLAVIAAIVASIAAVASAVIALAQWRSSKPRLEVTGEVSKVLSSQAQHGPTRYSWQVRNVGQVAVTVAGVGFGAKDGENNAALATGLMGEQVLGGRLEAQASLTLVVDLDKAKEWDRQHSVRDVYVRTATGATFRGPNRVKFEES